MIRWSVDLDIWYRYNSYWKIHTVGTFLYQVLDVCDTVIKVFLEESRMSHITDGKDVIIDNVMWSNSLQKWYLSRYNWIRDSFGCYPDDFFYVTGVNLYNFSTDIGDYRHFHNQLSFIQSHMDTSYFFINIDPFLPNVIPLQSKKIWCYKPNLNNHSC